MLTFWPKLWLLSLVHFWIMPLYGADPASSYAWHDRVSTYRAYWDDPRQMLAEAEKLLPTIDPDKEPLRWLQVFCAYGMANDSIHLMPDLPKHLRTAKRLATELGRWELMIDTLIIEGSFIESLSPESDAGILAEFGMDISVSYEKAIRIAEDHNSVRDRYMAVRNYLGYLRNKGQSTRILKLLEHAPRDVMRKSPDFADIDRLTLKKNLVFLYKVANQDEKVSQITRELADECLSVAYRTLCTYVLYDYGVLLSAGRVPVDYPRAFEALHKAETMAAELDDTAIQAVIALMFAQISHKLHQFLDAIHHAQRAAKFARKIGFYASVGDAALIEADNYRRLKRYPEAIRLLTEVKKELPASLYYQHATVHKLAADIHSETKSWEPAYHERTDQIVFEKKFLEERGKENFSEQMVKLGLQLEQEKNRALLSEKSLQERERKTIVFVSLSIILIALFLLLGLLWVSRKNREIRKLHRFIETQVLQRFLPPKIVGEILAGQSHFDQKAQNRVVTILFADLVNFTESAEHMEPQDLTELLNGFFAEMSEVVFAHGGVIDKFIGDAIMVVFGAPQELTPDKQAEFSTRCARQLLECLQGLNLKWQERFQKTFAMRIGIHQGPGIVGTFGSNRRSDYTVIGHTVNLASRIEGKCLPNQILVSESVACFLPADSIVDAGNFQLKGIEQPVALFAVLQGLEREKLDQSSKSA